MTTVASLFSGAGGLDIGFLQANYDIIWSNDSDPHAEVIHEAAMQQPFRFSRERKHVTANLMDLPWEDIPDADVIIGGPPCQGFSVAGNQNPDDPRRFMVFSFASIVKLKRPQAFVMENVPNLAHSQRHRRIWEQLKHTLQEHYDLVSGVFDAYEYGTPQHRKRVFLVGLPKGHFLTGHFLRNLFEHKRNGVTVREILQAMPAYGALENDTKAAAKVTFARNPVLRSTAYSGMLLNGARPLNLDAPAYTLPAIMGGNKTPVVDLYGLESTSGWNGDRWDGLGAWIEGYHYYLQQGGNPYIGDAGFALRRITVEEAAALQNFPFRLPWKQVPVSSAYRLIGNAVPCQLAYAVAHTLKITLEH